MKNAAYWRGRFAILEQQAHALADDTIREMEKAYLEAALSVRRDLEAWYLRFAKNNEMSLSNARKLLNSRELEEFKWTVEKYVEKGESLDPQWAKKLENASCKFHISRLEAIELEIQQQIEVLFGNQVDALDALLSEIVGDGYTRTAYEIQKGLGVGWNITKPDEKVISTLLTKPWTTDMRTFRDRCWVNKEALVDSVHKKLTQAILRGDSPAKTTAAIEKEFRVSKYKARRLVHTETSYFRARSSLMSYQELGVEQVEVLETLDSRTCPICGGMDGKVIPLGQVEPGVTVPPYHPNCRGTTVPYFEDMKEGKRAARGADGKTYYVPEGMTYEEWKRGFLEEKSEDGLTEEKTGDKIILNFEKPELLSKHYQKHRLEFGDISEDEYLEMANSLLREKISDDVEEINRSDGSVSRYKVSSNEFVVLTKEGTIRTYFKPVDGKEYWVYEHERN